MKTATMPATAQTVPADGSDLVPPPADDFEPDA
jgi:hypothetical protein